MTATTSSNQELQVSISFGKFENDSLSWEKFSSFSPNKYLEEVEKCATPGSVAQKKAYFESHYKKIAERKAEIILEQEKQLEKDTSFSSSLQNHGKTESVMIESSECYGSNGVSISEEDKLETSIATEVNEPCIDEPLEETMNFEECESSVDAGDNLNTMKLEKVEKIVLVEEKADLIIQLKDKEIPEEVMFMEEEVKEEMEEDISPKDTSRMNETPMKETKKEKDKNLIKKTDKNVRTLTRGSPKPNQMNKKPVTSKIVTSRKTQPSKEKSMIKPVNKAASPVSRAPGISTPRVSKRASTISPVSTSLSSAKKENVSTLPRKKQTAPKTLHTSLNMTKPSSDPTALATTRKSLFMEQMGDKEIVRRAFKSFQKSFDHSKPSGDGEDTAPKQVPAKATSVSRLANGRPAKSNDTEKKDANSYRSLSSVSKSNGTAHKQEIQLSKAGARAVERIRLPAKPKAEAINAKTRRQSLDPKEKPMQGPLPKGSSNKIL